MLFALLFAVLFADDPVGRTGLADPCPKGRLRIAVRVRDRGEVGLGRDDEVDGPEPGQGDGVGQIGELQRELEVGIAIGQAGFLRPRAEPGGRERPSSAGSSTSSNRSGRGSTASPAGTACDGSSSPYFTNRLR